MTGGRALRPTEAKGERFVRWAFVDLDEARQLEQPRAFVCAVADIEPAVRGGKAETP